MKAGIQNLTEGKVFPSLIKLALPLMGTSFVQMAYNLMAMTWVGRLGSEEEAAIGAIGMLLWLTVSVSFVAMIGAEVTVGQSIGAKKFKKALIYASHTTTVAFSMGFVWAATYFVFAPEILAFFKLKENITEDAILYLRILTICIPFQFASFNFSGIYNGAGRSLMPFAINVSGLTINMILDPLLIFGIGFFPTMGLHGAAIGTVVAQLLVFCLFVFRIKSGNGIIGRFTFFIKPRWSYLKRIFSLGLPVSIMNSFFAIINMNLARVASIHGGHIGLMSQTTGGQIEGITWTTSQGFSTALSAFIAQNYSANKLERGKQAYLYTIYLMLVLGVIVSIAFTLFGGAIFGLIVPDEEAMRAGAEYLGVMGLVQIFMMLELTTQGMFNGVGRTIPPAIINITFNFARIPLAYALAHEMGIIGVWWAIAISTICKGTILPIWFAIIYKKIQRNTKKQTANSLTIF